MALVLHAGDKPNVWFADPQPGSVRRFMREIRIDTLLAMTAAEHRRALKNLSHVNDSNTRGLLQSILCDFPRTSNIPGRLDGIFGPELEDGKTVDDLTNSLEFDARVQQMSRTLEVGADTHLAFERMFAQLASVAKQVEIVDPYLTSKFRNEPSEWWLVAKLLEYPNLKLTVFSNLPKVEDADRRQGLNALDLVNRCEINLLKQRELNGTNSRIHVIMYHLDPEKFHNRRIRFIFDSCSIGYIFEKGSDAFAKRIASEQHVFSAITEQEFLGHFNYLNLQPVAKELEL
jgi:hypothetical protein